MRVSTIHSSKSSRYADSIQQGLKGSVSISSVERGGQVKLAFSGPGKLKKGIEMALRDDERVTDIIFVGESQ